MEARQRLGAILVVAGVAVALLGVAGTLGAFGSPTTAVASPTAASSPPATEPAMSADRPPTPPATAAPVSVAPTEDTLGIVRAFFAELETAVHTGAQESMADRLGDAVIERYGLDACTQDLEAKDPFPEQGFEILAVLPPASWDYVTDGLTTTIADATTVQARVTGPDASGTITTAERELHIQVLDGVVRWFTDCGTPLGG